MAFTASGVFKRWILTPLVEGTTTSATGYTSTVANTINVALYNNTGTPDKDAATAVTGYNSSTSAWVTANEVTDVTNWVAGGRQLLNDAFSAVTNAVMYDADDLAGGGNVTISNAYGCLVYNNTISGGTIAKQGQCFNYFGGAQSVTGGTFTIVWNANGLFRFNV